MRRAAAILITLILSVSMLAGCTAPSTPPSQPETTPQTSPGTTPPEGSVDTSPSQGGISDPAALVNDRCTRCHDLERVKAAKKDKAGWESTVARMRQNGAELTDTEAAVVVDFLASGGAAKL